MTDREAVTIDTLRIDTKVRPGQASIISTSGKHQLCGKQSRVYVYVRYSAGFGRENLHRQTDFISYFFLFSYPTNILSVARAKSNVDEH